jgi:hypothetical protein
MKITPHLFEALLKCPTKCWLRATNEVPAGNAYAQWSTERSDIFLAEGIKRLIAEARDDECTAPAAENLKSAAWQLAVDVHVQATDVEKSLADSKGFCSSVEAPPAKGGRRLWHTPLPC